MMNNTIPEYEIERNYLFDYNNHKVLVNQNTIRDEEMQQLYQIIMKLVVQIVLPHYLLLMLLNYVYKPRLSRMIVNFS